MAEYFDPNTGEIIDATITEADIQSLANVAEVDFDTAARWLSEGLTPDLSGVLGVDDETGEANPVTRGNLDELTDEEYHRYFAGELISKDGLTIETNFTGTERHYEKTFDTLGGAVDHAQRMIAGYEKPFEAKAIDHMKVTQDSFGVWHLEFDTFDPVGEEWYDA